MGILQKMIQRFASIFTRKSIGEKVWARLFAGYGAYGLPGAWSADRREMALHYRGWTYIAIRVIAEEIAALQPQVGFVRSPQEYEERVGEILKSCHPGRERQAEQAFRKRFRSRAAVRKSLAQLQEHEEIELVDNDHRLLRLLRNPNGWDTGFSFWFRTSMQLDIHGNFYWWCIPDGTGRTCEIWVLPSNWVWPSPNRDKDEIVSYYEVRPYGTPGAASSFVIPAEEIVHGMYPGPISMWDGFSPQTAMAPWIDVLESMDACQFAGFKNGVGFDATIELDPTMEDPEQATLKRLQERLKERSGEGHHKEPLVMAPGAKLTYPRGVAPYEMDYAGSGDQKKDWVLAGWGVSKFMAGLSEDVNKASSRTAVANFFRKVIRPRLLLIDGYATENLARELDDRLIVYHDDPTADDPEELRAQLTLEIQAKSVMINEIRTAFGREPIEGGDVIIGTPTDTPLLGPDAAENADELGEILATLKEAQQPEQPGMPGMPGMNGNGRSETGPTNRLPQSERNGKALETVGKGASHWHKTFNESDHPRDDSGKFGSGGGGAATPEAKPAKPENKLPVKPGGDNVDIHDPKMGRIVWTGPRHEAEQLLREQEEDEPGHGLEIRSPQERKPAEQKPTTQEPAKQELPPPSDYEKFGTGKPIKDATVYRGETIGGAGTGMAALGHGKYYALDPKVAQRFSKEGTVKASKVSVENPLVFHSDEDMEKFKKQAENETGLDFGKKGNIYQGMLLGEQPAQFTKYVLSKGHDAIVTTYKEAAGGRQLVVIAPKAKSAE